MGDYNVIHCMVRLWAEAAVGLVLCLRKRHSLGLARNWYFLVVWRNNQSRVEFVYSNLDDNSASVHLVVIKNANPP